MSAALPPPPVDRLVIATHPAKPDACLHITVDGATPDEAIKRARAALRTAIGSTKGWRFACQHELFT